MEIYNHPDCNGVLNPAVGDEQHVVSLPVSRGTMDMGPIPVSVVRSFWVLTTDELKMLMEGRGVVAATLVGRTHAPIRLDIVDAGLMRNASNQGKLVRGNGLSN